MEEKERYVIDYCDDLIFDTEKEYYPSGDTICKTLNRQDKQIKELEEENQQLKQQVAERNEYFSSFGCEDFNEFQNFISTFMLTPHEEQELIQQLKQQLHDLPKKIVCEISDAIERLSWRKRIYTNWEFDKEQLYKDLDTILKKYGGKDERTTKQK